MKMASQQNLVAVADEVAVAVVVVVVLKLLRQHLTKQILLLTRQISMISAKSCLKKIRKILSAFRQAA